MLGKVYFVTPADPRVSYKGTERYIYEIVAYLVKNGVDAVVCVPDYSVGAFEKQLAGEKFPKVPEMRIAGKRKVRPGRMHFYEYELPEDGMVYLPYSPLSNMYNIVRKPAGQKYIIGSHGLHLHSSTAIRPYAKTAQRVALKLLGKRIFTRQRKETLFFHVLNQMQYDFLLNLGAKRENIFLVPVFRDLKNYRSKQTRSKTLKVLHVGGLGKSSDRLVDAISLLETNGKLGGFEFHLIGRSQPERVKTLAKTRHVFDHGPASDAEKTELMSRCDVLAITSVEAFSATVIEGMASGMHILTPANPGMQALEDDGAALTLYMPSQSELVKSLYELYNRKKSGTLSGKKNIRVSKRFSAERVLPQFKRMLEEVSKR